MTRLRLVILLFFIIILGSRINAQIIDTLSYTDIATDSFSMYDGEIGMVVYQMPGDGKITGFNIRVAKWGSDGQKLQPFIWRLQYPLNSVGELYSLESVDGKGWLGYYCTDVDCFTPSYSRWDGEWNGFGVTGPCEGKTVAPDNADPLTYRAWPPGIIDGAWYIVPTADTNDYWLPTNLFGEPAVLAGEWYGVFVKVTSDDTTKKVTFYASDGTTQITPWRFLIFSPQCSGISGEGGWHIRSVVVDWPMAVEYTLSSESFDDDLPTHFSLQQNIPNPFNTSTTIEYVIPENASTTLTIYNLLGEYVQTWNSNHPSPGTQTVLWNGTSSWGEPLPSGIYFYQLTVSTRGTDKPHRLVRKMVLLR